MSTLKRNKLIMLLILYLLTVLVMSSENPSMTAHNFIFYGGLFLIPTGILQLISLKTDHVEARIDQKTTKFMMGILIVLLGIVILQIEQFGDLYTTILIGASVMMVVWQFLHNRKGSGHGENGMMGHRVHQMGEKTVGFISW